MSELYNWDVLHTSQFDIVPTVLKKWKKLLDENLPERAYQSFLAEHAGFFLTDNYAGYAVISKLKLGAEFESDFVIIRDGFSNGTIYEFVEIEKPSSKLFTSSGIPATDFNTALQQIRDWRNFLKKNKTYFSKFLPTTSTRVIHDSNIKFKIIIGRRENQRNDIEKR